MKWHELPIVKFMHELAKEEWFKLADGFFSLPLSDPNYDSSTSPIPQAVTFHTVYGSTQITFVVYMSGNKYLYNPISKTMCSQLRRLRTKRTVNVRKMVEIVAKDFEGKLDDIDEKEADQLRREVYTQRCVHKLHNLATEIGMSKVKILNTASPNVTDSDGTQSPLAGNFECLLSKRYRVSIDYNEPAGMAPLHISIDGRFTMDEVKTLFNTITGMPSVMADRIKNGK